jgi:hypothetical protein
MKTIFTTGEAATICQVSQQTIIRCFDNGPSSLRVPLIKIVPIATAVARGGPRTPDEKDRSRTNALIHGLTVRASNDRVFAESEIDRGAAWHFGMMEGRTEAAILEKRRSADQKVRAVRAQGWTLAPRGQTNHHQEGTVKRQIKEDLALANTPGRVSQNNARII